MDILYLKKPEILVVAVAEEEVVAAVAVLSLHLRRLRNNQRLIHCVLDSLPSFQCHSQILKN